MSDTDDQILVKVQFDKSEVAPNPVERALEDAGFELQDGCTEGDTHTIYVAIDAAEVAKKAAEKAVEPWNGAVTVGFIG